MIMIRKIISNHRLFRNVLIECERTISAAAAADAALLEKFKQVHPSLVSDVLQQPDLKELTEAKQWYKQMLEYNTIGGKYNRGFLVVEFFEKMAVPKELTDENIRLACVLGWCVEMMQGWILLIDDMMDQSVTRRGRPCWYRTNNLGPKAANDGFIIEASSYYLLNKHFRDKPYYPDIFDTFQSVTSRTMLGQFLDTHSSCRNSKEDLMKVTPQLAYKIALLKTAYYTIYMPAVLGMQMAGKGSAVEKVEQLLLSLGVYFQAQDDVLDCFGDPAVTGKIGTDIEDGKCTWLLGKALELGTKEQKAVLMENYGLADPKSVAVVKKIYNDIGLPAIFLKYEQESYNEALETIEKLPSDIPKEPFVTILRRLHKRNK